MGPRLVGRGKLSEPLLWTKPCCASMGPRLVGRGKLLGLREGLSVPLEASMGPRLVGRGKHGCSAFVLLPTRASMGPRLVGRGKDYNNSIR